MQVGSELEAAPGWMAVEADLYDIAGRVKEYDSLACLVVEAATGRLGIARWNERWPSRPGGAYCLARECVDRVHGGGLFGVPDARVLWDMRLSDAHTQITTSFDAYVRRQRDLSERARERAFAAGVDEQMVHAERVAHDAYTKDAGWKPSIRVPRAVAA